MAVYSQRREIGKVIQFRTILVLNVEKKYYLAILARRMNTCILENQCFGIVIQKGGLPGVSGYIKLASV